MISITDEGELISLRSDCSHTPLGGPEMSTTLPIGVRPFKRVEFTCTNCGVMCRVDYEYEMETLLAHEKEYRHCAGDLTRRLTGPIVAIWEKRGDQWTLVANRNVNQKN